MAVGTGQDLRDEAFRAAGDPFALYDAGLSRALGCHAGASPVTAILADPNVRFARLGELTVWARVHLLDTEDSGEARGTGLLGTPVGVLAESITYWLWQIHRAQPLLVSAPDGISELQVEATLSRLPGEGETAEAGPPLHGWVVHEPDIAPCNPIVRGAKSVAFAIHGWLPATNAAGDPPNALDRQLVGALIDGLVSLNARPEEWPEPRRATLIDVIAPPGLKVMTRVLRAEDSLLLWPVGVPSARHVSEAVSADVLDRLGEHLAAAGFRVGPIARPDRTGFLNNDVTGYLIAWLEQEISRLDAPSAVQRLILMYEALLHESADDLDQLPTRIACFGDAAADVKRIQRNRRTSMTTSIALRYLIEYVSASAPSGTGVLTVEKYDLLLALAAEIVNKGMLSDTLRYGLADNAISILPSGRFGVQREQEAYSEALAAFSESLAQQTVQQAADLAAPTRRQPHSGRVGGPSHNERSDDAAKSGPPLADLDVLATAEYGFSYSQIVAACGALLDAASERGYENVATFDVSTVRRVIGTATGLGEDATDSMMAALSIAPLDDYWARGADAYPWRFNRDRSYLRRPLIRMPATGANDAVLLFGLRSTWLAPRHWLERHLSGRLRARSDAMRRALAVQRKVKGEEFEAAVEQELRRAGFPQTRRRFTRAGSLNLHDVNGEDLGDVDVLLVSRQGLLVAIEAKSLEAARTPVELTHEVDTLTSGDKAATIRIARRADALAQHLPEVEEALGLPHEARRRVVPLVVTDVALLGNYLSTSNVAIVALDALVDALTAIDAERRRR